MPGVGLFRKRTRTLLFEERTVSKIAPHHTGLHAEIASLLKTISPALTISLFNARSGNESSRSESLLARSGLGLSFGFGGVLDWALPAIQQLANRPTIFLHNIRQAVIVIAVIFSGAVVAVVDDVVDGGAVVVVSV